MDLPSSVVTVKNFLGDIFYKKYMIWICQIYSIFTEKCEIQTNRSYKNDRLRTMKTNKSFKFDKILEI